MIVIRNSRDAFRQGGVNFIKAGLHTGNDIGCVCAVKFQDQTRDDFTFAVGGSEALADAATNDDFAKVTDANRTAILGFDDDFRKVFDRTCKANAPNGILLCADFEKLRALGFITAFKRAHHIPDLQIIGLQGIRIELNLILFLIPAKR